jgi:hypothetical protein
MVAFFWVCNLLAGRVIRSGYGSHPLSREKLKNTGDEHLQQLPIIAMKSLGQFLRPLFANTKLYLYIPQQLHQIIR